MPFGGGGLVEQVGAKRAGQLDDHASTMIRRPAPLDLRPSSPSGSGLFTWGLSGSERVILSSPGRAIAVSCFLQVSPLAHVEETTQTLARALLEHARTDDPWVPDAAWWDERLLDFCMDHPHLKAELFRFIDVLPALPPGDVSGHLIEYLRGARADLPAPLRFSVDLTQGGTIGKIVSRAARRNVLRMARRFIAGSSVGEVVAAIRGMRRRRLGITLDALGEAVLNDREAEAS